MLAANAVFKKLWGHFCTTQNTDNNKLLVILSAIAAHQAKATVATEQAVDLLLNYVATYPNDGIVY